MNQFSCSFELHHDQAVIHDSTPVLRLNFPDTCDLLFQIHSFAHAHLWRLFRLTLDHGSAFKAISEETQLQQPHSYVLGRNENGGSGVFP